MENKKYQVVNVRLPIKTHEKVKKECEEMNMSISAFFNMLAKNYFRENEALNNLEIYKTLLPKDKKNKL